MPDSVFKVGTTSTATDVVERPRWVKVTQSTLENLTKHYVEARDQANGERVWPWAGMFVAFLTAATNTSADPATPLNTLILRPEQWQGIYLVLALISLGVTFVRVVGVLFAELYDRDVTRNSAAAQSRRLPALRINAPADWVPTNVRAYVNLVMAQLAAEEAARKAEEAREAAEVVAKAAVATPAS